MLFRGVSRGGLVTGREGAGGAAAVIGAFRKPRQEQQLDALPMFLELQGFNKYLSDIFKLNCCALKAARRLESTVPAKRDSPSIPNRLDQSSCTYSQSDWPEEAGGKYSFDSGTIYR